MSGEKYPAELVEKVAKATADHNMVGDALNLGYYRTKVTCSCGATLWWGEHDGDPKFGDVWNQHIAVAALDALGLTVTERWQAEWRGRIGVNACATNSRESATVLAGEDGTVRRRFELRAEWSVGGGDR